MDDHPAKPSGDVDNIHDQPARTADDLVQFLTQGEHPVLAGRRADRTIAAFQESLRRRFVHVTFTDTIGETELGFELDSERSDVSQAVFDPSQGMIYLSGSLTLDNVPVRVSAEIDLSTLQGHGRLEYAAPPAGGCIDSGVAEE